MSRKRTFYFKYRTHKEYLHFLILRVQRARRAKIERQLRKQQAIDKGLYTPSLRQREIKWANNFFPRLVRIMATPMAERKKKLALQEAAVESLEETGYRTPLKNKDGSPNLRAVNKAKELMELPKMQKLMKQKFEASGVTDDKCMAILSQIMDNFDANPNAAISVIKLYFNMTIPQAPQRIITQNQNMNLNQDLPVYNKETWSAEPDLDLS